MAFLADPDALHSQYCTDDWLRLRQDIHEGIKASALA